MVQGNGFDPHVLFRQHCSWRVVWRNTIAPDEGIGRTEFRGPDETLAFELHDMEAEVDGMLVEKVPGETSNPMLHLIDKS